MPNSDKTHDELSGDNGRSSNDNGRAGNIPGADGSVSALSAPLAKASPSNVAENCEASVASEADGQAAEAAEVAAVAQSEAEQRLLFGGELAAEFYARQGVWHRARFIRNSRGMRLYTQIWGPVSRAPKALLCCCHGFGNDTSWMFQLTCVRFASEGYAVCALDLEGHGRSDGLRCAVRSIDAMARDCLEFFASVHGRKEFQDLPCFLFGESMGGAISLLIVNQTQESAYEQAHSPNPPANPAPVLAWAGVILVSPMLRIKEEMRPHWLVVTLLQGLAYIIPDAAIVPSPETIRMSCRDPQRLDLAMANPNRYLGKPRLGAAVEMLRVTERVTQLMPAVELPFLVIHGEADVVTDCVSSKDLFAQAASMDKTLHLYPGGGHQMLQGEAEEFREKVWSDVLSWLKKRTSTAEATRV